MKGVNERLAASFLQHRLLQLCRKGCPDVAAKFIFQHLRKGSETLTLLRGFTVAAHESADIKPDTAHLSLLSVALKGNISCAIL